MDAPLPQTSVAPTGGPVRSQRVIDPIVDDLAEVFKFLNATVAEVNAIWVELKNLQPNAVVLGQVNSDGSIIVVSGDSYIVVTPDTIDGVTTYTITLNPAKFTSVPVCPDPLMLYGQ